MPSIKWQIKHLFGMLKRGQIGGAAGLVTNKFLNRNLWIQYLTRRRGVDGHVPLETEGVTLFLDPDDDGISRDLFTYGTREEQAKDMMRRHLELLRLGTSGSITVLEIGANKGYYAFQIADLLGDRGDIHAVEPEPTNLEALERGVSANGFENITLESGAIGDSDGTAELHVSNRSNSHTLNEEFSAHVDANYAGTIEISVWSVPTFLDRHDLNPTDVNVVRMDVEGYEAEIVESMQSIFEVGKPNLLFVELHPHRVDAARLHKAVDAIESASLNLLFAQSTVARLSNYDEIREHVTVPEGRRSVELIAATPPRENSKSTIGVLADEWDVSVEDLREVCLNHPSVRRQMLDLDAGEEIDITRLQENVKSALTHEPIRGQP